MSLMSGEEMNANIDTEALMYVESVIRRHLTAVLAQCDIPAPLGQMWNDAQLYSKLERIIGALEEDRDFNLSYLLRGATNIREEVIDETAESIDQLLRAVVDTMEDGTANELMTLSQTVFEALVRREEYHSEASFSVHPPAEEPPSRLTVFINDVTMEVPFPDILTCFWTTVLETVCHVCNQPFVDEPPIRTIAKHELMECSQFTLPVRVANRHLSCLRESGVLFIPVSHVWDQSIRRANETQTHDEEAAITLVSALRALLQGAENAYGPGVEFWHDYYSVPQWEIQTKESLLVHLPAIYHQAEKILVHMADIPPGLVSFLLAANAFGIETPMVEAFRSIPFVHDLSEAQWMKRMWVTLEHSQSRAACIMDGSNHIRRFPGGNDVFSRDTFSLLIDGCLSEIVGLHRYAENFGRSCGLSWNSLGGIAKWKRDGHQLCLGEAMELVAEKQCQVFRDCFLAIHLLLNRNESICEPVPLPRPVDEACQWVWRDALCKGDYSALLLQPREYTPFSNLRPDLPSWLVGHQSLEGAEWALAAQTSSPERLPIIVGEAVKVPLDFVGNIEEIHHLEVEESGTVDGVEKVMTILSTIARREGTRLSPQSLYDGLSHVFPAHSMYRKIASHAEDSEGMVFSFEECQEEDDKFTAEIHRQLEVFHSSHESHGNQRRHAAAEICSILQMEKNVMREFGGELTRLTYSYKIAHLRAARGAEGGEPICEVRCPQCRTVTLLRLDLRVTGRIGDRVYRIPGLGYSKSVENGVGLILDNCNRITGRMLYGSPACDCRLIETVDIR